MVLKIQLLLLLSSHNFINFAFVFHQKTCPFHSKYIDKVQQETNQTITMKFSTTTVKTFLFLQAAILAAQGKQLRGGSDRRKELLSDSTAPEANPFAAQVEGKLIIFC